MSASYDIEIDAGSDWNYPITYEVGTPPVAVDLIGPPEWSAEASFWDANGMVLRFTVGPVFAGILAGMAGTFGAIVRSAGGNLAVSMTSLGSYMLTSSGRWELRIVDGAGKQQRILRGQMVVRLGPVAGVLTGGEGY